jgi:L-histidine Nalpha-methyltransferase / hercynylcysteine S-oxide synthase
MYKTRATKLPASWANTGAVSGPQVLTNGNDRRNGDTNGHTNGHSNGHTNGHTNGHVNGHTNGHTNGNTNGQASLTNGNVNRTNGYANGHGNGISNRSGSLDSVTPESFLQGKAVRTVYGLVPLKYALDWPIFASYDELAGCASWMGGRIPTFEEVKSIYAYVDFLKRKETEKKLGKTLPAVNGYEWTNCLGLHVDIPMLTRYFYQPLGK